MKKLIGVLLTLCLLGSLVACGSSNDDQTPAENGSSNAEESTEEKIYSLGETVTTDVVEFTLNDCRIADHVGLESDNWLKPDPSGSLAAPDGEVFVCLFFTANNISKEEIDGYDVSDITIDYDGGYQYGDGTYTGEGMYDWSTNGSISSNVGLPIIKPLEEASLYGYIYCADDIKENRTKETYAIVKLPDSKGTVEFKYDISADENSATGEEAMAVSDAMSFAIDQLEFIKNNSIGEKFADEFVDSTRNAFAELDNDYIAESLPETAEALPGIIDDINTICDLVEDMGSTGSTENVDEIKSTCDSVIAEIEELQGSELKAFN